ncbi:hypothetical protein G6F55_013967 [Rhizopus delemar]|nr:hypothetical protein G6F55_013967 [Rhizopus delemar]
MPAPGPNEVLNAHHARVLAAAEQSGKASVLPQRIEFTQSLTVKADVVPAGETHAGQGARGTGKPAAAHCRPGSQSRSRQADPLRGPLRGHDLRPAYRD